MVPEKDLQESGGGSVRRLSNGFQISKEIGFLPYFRRSIGCLLIESLWQPSQVLGAMVRGVEKPAINPLLILIMLLMGLPSFTDHSQGYSEVYAAAPRIVLGSIRHRMGVGPNHLLCRHGRQHLIQSLASKAFSVSVTPYCGGSVLHQMPSKSWRMSYAVFNAFL